MMKSVRSSGNEHMHTLIKLGSPFNLSMCLQGNTAEKNLQLCEYRDEAGRQALHIAAGQQSDNPHIISMLLGAGANPNAQDNQGNTPLHLAAMSGNTQYVNALFSSSKDFDLAILNNRKQSALDLFGEKECAGFVKKIYNSNPELVADLFLRLPNNTKPLGHFQRHYPAEFLNLNNPAIDAKLRKKAWESNNIAGYYGFCRYTGMTSEKTTTIVMMAIAKSEFNLIEKMISTGEICPIQDAHINTIDYAEIQQYAIMYKIPVHLQNLIEERYFLTRIYLDSNKAGNQYCMDMQLCLQVIDTKPDSLFVADIMNLMKSPDTKSLFSSRTLTKLIHFALTSTEDIRAAMCQKIGIAMHHAYKAYVSTYPNDAQSVKMYNKFSLLLLFSAIENNKITKEAISVLHREVVGQYPSSDAEVNVETILNDMMTNHADKLQATLRESKQIFEKLLGPMAVKFAAHPLKIVQDKKSGHDNAKPGSIQNNMALLFVNAQQSNEEDMSGADEKQAKAKRARISTRKK
jgi:hypothetical protein